MKTCELCRCPLTRYLGTHRYKRARFCSIRCATQAQRKQRRCETCTGDIDGRGTRRRFCSKKCYGAWRSTHVGPCLICGERKATNSNKTCSRRCQAVHRRRHFPRPCRSCGQFFTRRTGGPYCSRRCAAVQVDQRNPLEWRRCSNCGNALQRRRSEFLRAKHGHVFCGVPCRAAYLVGASSPVWKGGHRGYRGRGWPKLAQQIRDRDGHICRHCGKTEAENGRALDVDHVIPWRLFSDAEAANDPDNLLSLCVSCHGYKTTSTTVSDVDHYKPRSGGGGRAPESRGSTGTARRIGEVADEAEA